ncbi:Elongation factor 1-gamma [Yarrowia sp. C11]|nr:Elongation factor 1-gamma [Yarrowia sp. E02]KAG5371748.1 Elongation factor 1-gamma [Yarrowia sp. C11]
MELYSYVGNSRSYAIFYILDKAGVKFTLKESLKGGVFPEDMDARFPLRKIPDLVDGDFHIRETMAVTIYLGDKYADKLGNFVPQGTLEMTKALEWMSFANTEHIPTCSLSGLMVMGQREYVKKVFDQNVALANRNVDVVFEPFLKNNTFLIGERLTYVDIFVAGATLRGFTQLWDKKWQAAHPHFTRWFKTVVNQPEFVKLFGETELCEVFKAPK